MTTLTEIALLRSGGKPFTRVELDEWVGGSEDRRNGMLKRALAAGDVLRIHRGIYCLAGKYLPQALDPRVLAQRIHGPSYISLETALAYHGLIPESVQVITSGTAGRSREFGTPIGWFSFSRVPQKTLYAGVERVENRRGEAFLLASPLKALADYVYVAKCDWRSALPVISSLRVEEDDLERVDSAQFDALAGNYSSRRVRRFLAGLREDLCP